MPRMIDVGSRETYPVATRPTRIAFTGFEPTLFGFVYC